jgi:glutamate carboxypeptidase
MPKTKTSKLCLNCWYHRRADRLRFFTDRLPQLVTQTIREFVEIESPSDHKPSADRMGAILAERFRRPRRTPASAPRADYRRSRASRLSRTSLLKKKSKPVLLLGHFDTVYPLGTLATMPCHASLTGRCTGPACST